MVKVKTAFVLMLVFFLQEASVHMIVLASRQFVLVDGSSIYVYSYDGRLLHQPKYTTLKTDTLNSNSLSLSNDTIAIKVKDNLVAAETHDAQDQDRHPQLQLFIALKRHNRYSDKRNTRRTTHDTLGWGEGWGLRFYLC